MNIVKGSKDPTPAEYRVKIEVETDKGRNFTASHMCTALKILWNCVSGLLLVPWWLQGGSGLQKLHTMSVVVAWCEAGCVVVNCGKVFLFYRV